MTDKREVRMVDLVQALSTFGIHAKDCDSMQHVCDYSKTHPGQDCLVLHNRRPCTCWVERPENCVLIVNG
jgi:hypothetical protein